jgi:hypothetical protein
MGCDEVRNTILEGWDGEVAGSAREHLAGCAACQAFARRHRLLRAGFGALAAEPPREPSWGFATRVMRRLEEAAVQRSVAEEFLERVGRRVVYVTCVLALMLVLALTLPATGPVRGPAAPDLNLPQPEMATLGNDPVLTGEYPLSRPAVPLAGENAGSDAQK